jgi:hypothetical protein
MNYKERGGKIAEAKRMPTEEFIRRANLIHNNQYNYDKVNYVNAHTKVTIGCPVHGEWDQKPMVHLTDRCGCPVCGNIKKGIKKKESSYQKFLLFANNKHQGKYTYIDSTFISITKKMTIVCPIHGEFYQSPDVHKRAGCQRCGSGPVSNSSQKWLDSINVPKEYRETWITTLNNRIKVDAFNPLTNTVYEYWGDYWHGNPRTYDLEKINSNNKLRFRELYNQTLERINLIESLGYNLVQIWEDEWLATVRDSTAR